MLKDIVLLAVITGTVLYILYYLRREGFVNPDKINVIFMTKEQTYNYLHSDLDGYISNLSPTDLYARKANSINNYRLRAADSAIDFTTQQKNRYMNAIRKANILLSKLQLDRINCAEIAAIPWIFGLTKERYYEDGLPHTRSNVIFVSSVLNENEDSLVKTLIHEKIHIYQRLHPEEISFYLESKGYIKSKHGLGIPRIRSNPDLDGWIYYSPITKKEMAAYYSSDTPSSITDITLSDASFEHPYELMAYTITEKLIS